MRAARLSALVALLAALALVPSAAADVWLSVDEDGVNREQIEIDPDEMVTWSNDGEAPVTVSSQDGIFDSGPIPPEGAFSIKVPVPGDHAYTTTSAGESHDANLRVRFERLPGSPFALVNGNLPDVPFPPLPAGDLGIHPEFGISVSKTRILLRFTDTATVLQANAAIQFTGVEILGAIPDLGIVLVEAPPFEDDEGFPMPGFEFFALDFALQFLGANPAVETASMSPEVVGDVVPRRADIGFSDGKICPTADEAKCALAWDQLWSNGSPVGIGGNWGLEASRFPQAWNLKDSIAAKAAGDNAHKVDVVVVDEGVAPHNDLPPVTPQPLCLTPTKCSPATVGDHATHVAGIIGAAWNNDATNGRSRGISGANPAVAIHSAYYGFGQAADLADSVQVVQLLLDAIEAGTMPNVRVVNFSLGSSTVATEPAPNHQGKWRLKWWSTHPTRSCGPGADDDGSGNQWCTMNNDDKWIAANRKIAASAREVAKRARGMGVTIVQSAGNAGDKFCVPHGDLLFPASYAPCDSSLSTPEVIHAINTAPFALAALEPEGGSDEAVIIVENIRRDLFRAPGSNIGGEVSAPGEDIFSTVSGGAYALKSGTSMAAPHVAALISYLLAYDPTLTPKEVKQRVLEFARPDTEDRAKPRIDAYNALLSLTGAARDLVDVNDLSPDGSRRAILKKDGTEVADKRKVVPDGVVDMRDFRAFRDAWMTTCFLDRSGEGCPPSSLHILLNEVPNNVGFDLNGDGCVFLINPVAPCTDPIPEPVFPRHDYNGDGFLGGAHGSFTRVALKPDGSPATDWFEMTPMSDLGVLQSQWPSDADETDGWTADDLTNLMWSGDIELHAEALHKLGATNVEVSVEPVSGGETVPKVEFDPEDAAVITAPIETAGTTYTVNASAEIDGETVHTAPVDISLGFGEDVRVDLCATALDLQATKRVLTAGSSETVTVRTTLQGCAGTLDVEGRPITFTITPTGPGHATLAPMGGITDAAGEVTSTFTTGTETGEYEITASYEVSENRELTATTKVRVGSAMKIAYIWRQQVYDWREGGVPGLTNRWAPTPGMPDCTQTRSYCIDGFFLGLSDGDSDGFSMTRTGTISGGGSDLRLTEQVLDYGGYASARWSKAEHAGQTSTGSDTVTYGVENPTEYTGYDLGGKLRADDDADGVRLRGLKEIAELPYRHRRTGSQQNFPPELWDFHHRFMLGPRGDGSALKFHADVDRAVFFPRQQDGSLGTYAYCGTETDDLTTEPGYLLIDDDDWVTNGIIGDRTKIYANGLLPMPYGPGSVKYRWSFAAVAYYSDEDAPALALPDCTASTQPEADFSFTPGEPGEGRVVQFTDLSKDAENDLESWHWDFGDGTTDEGETPHHLYDDNGTYPVQLTVQDSQGHSASVTKQVEVRNLPPVAGLDDAVIQVGSPLRLRARSVDPGKLDKQSLGLRLTSTNPDFAPVEIANAQAIHGIEVLDLPVGSYPLTLTVTDKDGATGTAKALVVVTTAAAPPPPPTPPGGPTCDPDVSLDGEALIFLDEVNAYRLQNGLVAVGASPTLTTAAQRHADDMAENEFMAHEGSDGSTPHERAEDAGYTGSSTSENVARGLDTGVEVLFGWQASVTGHNEAMLEPAWRAVGVARAQSDDGEWFWATTYGNELDCGGEQAQALASFAAAGEATAFAALGDEQAPELAYPPVPALVVSTEWPSARRPVTFVNRSRDSAGMPVRATLHFGDGTPTVQLGPDESVQHAYEREGDYWATLTAFDAAGVQLSVRRAFEVEGPPQPGLAWVGDLEGVVGGTATVGGRATDPETGAPIAGLTLTFRIGSATATAVTDADGRATTQLSLAGLAAGHYAARVTFAGNADWNVAEVTANTTFRVAVNTAPIANAGGPYVVGIGTDLVVDGSRSRDGDQLDRVVSWNWDLDNDGAFDDLAGPTPRPFRWDEIGAAICGGLCSTTETYPLALRVVDRFGLTDVDSTTLSFTSDFAILLAREGEGKTLVPGASNSFAVSVIGSGGFTHPVTLTVEGLPPGITATWTNNPVTPTGIAVLRLTAGQNVPNGSFPVVVTGTGGGITRTVSDSIEVAFGLIPICTTSISGTVRDQTSGAPLAGVDVSYNFGSRRTTTGDNGRYVLNNVALGPNNLPVTYTILAQKNGFFAAATATLAVCGAASTADLTMLARQTGLVSGRVVVGLADPDDHTHGRRVLPTNEPIPEATVWAHSTSVEVDSEGRYSMDNLALNTGNSPATHHLSATAPGYWSQDNKSVTVELGVPKTLNFELVRVCTARVTGGIVRWRDTGEPVPGAEVHASLAPAGGITVTDENGVYRFDRDVPLSYNNSSRSYYLQAHPPSGSPQGASGEQGAVFLEDCGDAQGVDLYLDRPTANYGVLEGTVTDEETGDPLAGQLVRVGFAGSVQTDQNGYWRIANVFLGYGDRTSGFFTARVTPTGYWEDSESVVLQAGTTERIDLVVLKQRYAGIEGTIRDLVTGAPIAGATCSPAGICETTGPDGAYAASGLSLDTRNAPRDLFLTAFADGYWTRSGSALLEAGKTTRLDLQLLKKCTPARVVGTVVNAETQAPIEGAHVRAGGRGAFTNAAGRFDVTDVQPGNGNTPLQVDVTASATGFFSQTKQVTIFCGATIVVDFGRRETQLGAIVGTVIAAGQPAAGVFVGSEFGGSAITGADGSYRLANVPLGDLNTDREWSVTAVPEGFEPKSKTVVAKANEDVRADFEFTDVPNRAPVGTADSFAVDEDSTLVVPAPGVVGNDTDPDDDAVTAVDASAAGHGTVTLLPSGGFTYAPAGDFAGSDAFTYRTSDGTSKSGPVTVAIEVRPVNDAPTASGAEAAVDEDGSVTIDLLANDVEGDALTFVVVQEPAHGAVDVAGAQVRYSPARGFNGEDSFTFRASDGAAASAPATVRIVVRPVGDPPVCRDIMLTLPEDGVGVVGPDCTDADGDTLQFEIVEQPRHGSLAALADGSFAYTPDRDWHGVETLSYSAFDNDVKSAAATVTITVQPVNDVPVATPVQLTIDEDTTGSLVLGGVDADGDALDVEVVTPPVNGVLNGGVYNPARDWHGTETIRFVVRDGSSVSEPVVAGITVRPVNDAPTARDDVAATDEDSVLRIPVAELLANDADVDGDALAVSSVTDGAHAQVSLEGAEVVYRPAADWNGTDEFTAVVSDSQGGTARATVSLTVRSVNDRPTVALAPAAAVDEGGQPTRIVATAVDVDGDHVSFEWSASGARIHGAGASAEVSADDGPASATVTVQVSDGALTAADTTTVQIRNVAPTATAPASARGVWGMPLPLAGSVDDASAADREAGLQPRWALGGRSLEGASIAPVFDTPQTLTGVLTAKDKDGATASASTAITVAKRTTTLRLVAADGPFGFASVTAELRDTSDAGTAKLAGCTIVFTVDSREIVITTDAEGRARLPLDVALAGGPHEVSARFAENALYLGTAAATTTVTVTASRGKVTGGVTVAAGKATFEANADGKVLKGGLRWGSFNGDVTVLGVAADGRAAWFGGGTADGRTFVAYVEDNGEPGRNDVFRLWIAGTLVTPDGTVTAGNLQIHRSGNLQIHRME